MTYSDSLASSLTDQHADVQADLERLFVSVVRAGEEPLSETTKEYMLHGVGRRVGLLRHCLRNVFSLFPPNATVPLQIDVLYGVQIHLHAFVINLYGAFENLAWAFVVRHSLEADVGGRKKIGMFLRSTQRFLPPELKAYVTSNTMVRWHDEYLKSYRDSLAHRIPLYIPPSTFTPADGERYHELEQTKMQCIQAREWDRLEQVRAEQENLGKPCPIFLHSAGDSGDTRPVYLHPQMLCDAKTLLEFGPLYLAHWHARA